MRHLLSAADLTRDEAVHVLDTAEQMAHQRSLSMVTSVTPSNSSKRTLTRSSAAVGRFLPTWSARIGSSR